MSMHTKAPWHCENDEVLDENDNVIGHILSCGYEIDSHTATDARRVVACVNACEGIPTSRLEAGAADVLAYSMELHKQREELLAALENLLKAADLFFADNEGLCGREQARAAIARAKGGAA